MNNPLDTLGNNASIGNHKVRYKSILNKQRMTSVVGFIEFRRNKHAALLKMN